MKRFPTAAPLFLVVAALSGCAGGVAMGNGGTVAAIPQPAAGAEIAAAQPGGAPAGNGTMVGGLIAGDIGQGLDRSDQQQALAAEYRALELGTAGTAVAWRGATGAGEVTPGPAYRVNAYACRDYSHTVTIAGQPRTARGTACREPDGTWRPVT